MSSYLYKGYKISNLGYHQPDHCVWWEAVDKDGCACFHGNTLREVEMQINDSEWEDKLKAKDDEIARLREIVLEMSDKLHHDYCCDNRNALDGCDIKGTCHNAGTCALVARARKEIKK